MTNTPPAPTLPMAAPGQPAAVPPPAPSRSRSTGRRLAWAFAIPLLLVGIGCFAVAAAVDNSDKKTLAADQALGGRDAGTVAKALDARVAQVKRAYDTYVAAERAEFSAHENVTFQFNEVVHPLDPLNLLGPAEARKQIPRVIAAYRAAVERERAARHAFVDELALLNAEVAR